MEEVHIHVIFLDKPFIELFTKWTNTIALLDFVVIFWDLNELIFNGLNLVFLRRVLWRSVCISFGLNRFLIEVSIISISGLHLFLNCLDDLRSDIFQEWLHSLISYLIGNCTYSVDSSCSNFVIFIIHIFHNIIYSVLVIPSQLIFTYYFTDHL